jgi:hypothetical protein
MSPDLDNEPIAASQTQLYYLETMHQSPSSPVENYTTASPPWSPMDQPTDFEGHKQRLGDITGIRGREHPEGRDFTDKLQEDLRKLEEGKEPELQGGEESSKRRSKRARKGTKGGMSSSTWTKKEPKNGNDKGPPPSGNGVEQPVGGVKMRCRAFVDEERMVISWSRTLLNAYKEYVINKWKGVRKPRKVYHHFSL